MAGRTGDVAEGAGLHHLAIFLLLKAVLLAARWSGHVRRRARELASSTRPRGASAVAEVLALQERVRELQSQVAILTRQLRARAIRKRYSLRERLAILWHLELYQVPRRKVSRAFGIARSTLYRWLRCLENQASPGYHVASRTPAELSALVWDIAMANVRWGRTRIAHQLRCLKVFLAASTVQRILDRPRPKRTSPGAAPRPATQPKAAPRSVAAFHPNHVWSVDRTLVRTWGLWNTYVLVAIDHFSRKVILTAPLEGPNPGWTCQALEDAFRRLGPPRHLITDKEGVFTGAAFKDLVEAWGIKLRHGAVGRHGSIAVTERVIHTLKHEWLDRVPLLRGFGHLARHCEGFVEWYNEWRPHTHHDGFTPEQVFCREPPEPVPRTAKAVPLDIERRVFIETKITGFRRRDAA